MGYDFSVIPTWIRQYAYHYFNRIVTIDLELEGGGARQTDQTKR